MSTIIRWGGGLLAAVVFSSVSFGYTWITPVSRCPLPVAPDACGPGYYVMGQDGMVYGPIHHVYPPFAPFQGVLPGRCGPGGQGGQGGGNGGGGPAGYGGQSGINFPQPGQQAIQNYFPTHPYIRSPRDFFMFNENLEDLRGRELRPNFVP